MPNSAAPPAIDRLKAIPIFEGIDDERLGRIAAMTTEFDAPAGQVLVAARHEASGLFILEEGRVVVKAGEAFVRELGPGELFGELAVINEGPRSATVISKTPVKCIAVGRADFWAMLDLAPEVAVGILKILASRVSTS